MSERDWIIGYRAAWARIYAEAVKEMPKSKLPKARLLKERAEAVAVLRRLCAKHGDNDWPDDLHLGDIIDKHLGRYL